MQHQLSKVLKKNFFVVSKNSFLHFYWCVHFFWGTNAHHSRVQIHFVLHPFPIEGMNVTVLSRHTPNGRRVRGPEASLGLKGASAPLGAETPWYREPNENDYYSSEQIDQLDRDESVRPIQQLDSRLLTATPGRYVSHQLLDAVLKSVSMTHPLTTSFDRIWSFLYRYITRSKIYADLFKFREPPWRDNQEAMKLMATSVGGGGKAGEAGTSSLFLLNSELGEFRVLRHNAFKANSIWYNHQRSLLNADRPTFTYTKYTVEIHFDQLTPYPPGTSPNNNNNNNNSQPPPAPPVGAAGASSFLERNGSAFFSNTAPSSATTLSGEPLHGAFVPQVTSPFEAMAKGVDLQVEMWAYAHRILVKREITERWLRPGVIIEESSRAFPTQLMAEKYPQGEHFLMGSARDLIGSTTSPSVPANIGNPKRLAQLGKISTPRTAAEVQTPGGYMVVNGKGRVPSFYLSRLEHSLLLCKSAGNKPMGLIHFDNPLTGSRDNVIIQMGTAKSIVYKKDEVASSSLIIQKSKARIGTSGTRSVLSFTDQERVTRPNYLHHMMDLVTSVAVANKYMPQSGNSCGLDMRYQAERITAGHQHMLNFRRVAAGLAPLPLSCTHVDPYDHTPIKNSEINCTKLDRERIQKLEKLFSTNTRSTEVILMKMYIQRIMILFPVLILYLALGFVTRESIHETIGHADDQVDADIVSAATGAVDAAATAEDAESKESEHTREPHDDDPDQGGVTVEDAAAEDDEDVAMDETDQGPNYPDPEDENMWDGLESMTHRGSRSGAGGATTADRPFLAASFLDHMESLAADEAARKRGLSHTPAPVPHRPPTALFEKRKLYSAAIDRSFDMYECIPEEARQEVAITHLGELYCSNIQMEHRNRTPYEYGLYFLDQCSLSMQGMLDKLHEDFKNDVPIMQAIRNGSDGSFKGSHTIHHVILDDRTRRTFWVKGMSLSLNIVNPFLRDWCGFRGAQHGQKNSLDEHQCDGIADMHKFHFRFGFRQVKDTYVKDIKRDLGNIFSPIQQWFMPHKACAKIKQDSAAERARLGLAAIDESTASSSSLSVTTAIDNRVPYPNFMQRLAREFPNVEPITTIMRKLTTRYEEGKRRAGTATMRIYQPMNASNIFTETRHVVAISNPHAGSFSRQYKNNFYPFFSLYGTTKNESSGQNNTLSVTTTISPALTQQEHVSVYHFVQRLLALRWVWAAAEDVYHFCVDREAVGGGMWCNATPAHFYSLIYGTDFIGWFHRDDFARVYHAWFMFKTHPNAPDGIRFLSLEAIHATRQLRIHMNPGRPTRMTWVVDVKEKTLRATRVSAKLRTLFTTHPDKLRAQDRLTPTQLYEELMLHRCVEWMDHFQGRHMVVASSMAAFVDSRQRPDVVYGAVEFHPAACLDPTELSIPALEHNGGTRSHAAAQMARAFVGHECGSFATNGEMRTPFTAVYPHRATLRNLGPVDDAPDGMQALVTWVNDPYTDQDSSVMSLAAIDLGAGMILMNETVKKAHDLTRAQAEIQLRVMSTTSLAMPTLLQKQQAQAALNQQIHQSAMQSVQQLRHLAGSPNASTAMIEALHNEHQARQEVVRQHMLGWHTASLAGGGGSGGTGAYAGAGVAGGGGGGNYIPLDASMNAALVMGTSSDPNPRDPLAASAMMQAQMSHFQATYLFEQDTLPENVSELHEWLDKTTPRLRSGTRVESALSTGPSFDWKTYCSVTGQSRNTMETDMFVDASNTVSFPAVVTSGMTLIRSAVLTPALVEVHARREQALRNLKQQRDSLLRQHVDPQKLESMLAVFRPVDDLPPVEYHRRPVRNKKPYMEITAVRWTLSEFQRQIVNISMSHLHYFGHGDKLTNRDGQKTVASLFRPIYAQHFSTSEEYPGMHAQIQRAAQNQPTRRTIADHICIVSASMACADPSRRLHTTHDTYQQMPLAFNEMTAEVDRRNCQVLGFNPHMLERMETKKNLMRFGKLLQRECNAACSLCAQDLVTTMAASAQLDALVMHQFFEQTVCRSTAAILQVSEWWVDVDYSHVVEQRWRALAAPNQVLVTPNLAQMFTRANLKRLWRGDSVPRGDGVPSHPRGPSVWKSGQAFVWMLPTVPVPVEDEEKDGMHVQGSEGTAGTPSPLTPLAQDERLLWLWWKDVYVECGETMKMGDVFWADLMHDCTSLAREIDQMHAFRDDIVTLGMHITDELTLSMAQQNFSLQKQQAIHNQQQQHRSHHMHARLHRKQAVQQIGGGGGGGGSALDAAASVSHLTTGTTDQPTQIESLRQQTMSSLLEQTPERYSTAFPDQKRTLDHLSLCLLKSTYRVALIWAALLPQVRRLERVFRYTQTLHATRYPVWAAVHGHASARVAWGPLEQFFAQMDAFAHTIRSYSELHHLYPVDRITHEHVQRYLHSALYVILNEQYAAMHKDLRPPPEADSNCLDAFWNAERWSTWEQTVDCIQAVAHEPDPAASASDAVSSPAHTGPLHSEADRWYDPQTTRSDALARKTYGYQRGGMLAAARDYWHRCWSATFCHRLMKQWTRVPFHLWAAGTSVPADPEGDGELDAGPSGPSDPEGLSSPSDPGANYMPDDTHTVSAHTRRGSKGPLGPLLRSHHEATHYLPSVLPQLLEMARFLVCARDRSVEHDGDDAEDAEWALYCRALQLELDHVMKAVPEPAIDGETGYPLQGGMWIGVSSEHVLPKIAQDLIKVNDGKGAVHIVSGQPAATNDGKGAGRWGGMEVHAANAAGAARLVRMVTCDQSDKHEADVCERCGRPSRYNHQTNQGWCAHCNQTSRGRQSTVYANSVISTVCNVSGITRIATIDDSINQNEFEPLD
jgi:hypothetical protein